MITLMEIAVQPLARGLPAVAAEYEAALSGLPNLTVVPITVSVARLAAGLRASYRLRSPDALQMAACMTEGATAFITNDRGLAKVREVRVLVLADLL